MKIFFHLGYPRTGTTFLQKNFFKDKRVNFIGRKINYGIQDKHFYQILFQIMDMNNKQYKREKKKILSIFKKINFSKKKINLISEEGIMCQNTWRNNDVSITLKRLIELIKMANFDVSFFMTIRNQQDCIISNFQYFYSSYFFNYYSSLEEFLNSKDTKKKKFFDSFNYLKIFNLFEKQNLKLNFFLYEDIFSKNDKFLKKFSNYLNIKIKVKNDFKKVNAKNDLLFKYRKYNIETKNLLNFSKLPNRIIKLYDLIKKFNLDKKINKTKIDFIIKNNIKKNFIISNRKLNKKIKLTQNYL